MSDHRLRRVLSVLRQLVADEAMRTVGLDARLGGSATTTGRDVTRAKSVRRALEDLGPFYVKVGQMLSTRPDIVPQSMVDEFQHLHDRVSIAPFADFEPVLESELGDDWRKYFREIETETPLGAASLAQVYRVVLDDGRNAVVKIQRPGVDVLMRADMALLRRASRLLAKRAPDFNEIVDVEATLETIFQAMEPEVDFTLEARHMDLARPLVAQRSTLTVPEVMFVTPKVMVQELAAGDSVGATDRQRLPADQRDAIGRDLLGLMYRGFFVDRFFHADPHAGNIFVAPDQPATIIDWGMVGRLDRRVSLSMTMVLLNMANNDGGGVAKAWIEMGQATSRANIPSFINDCSSYIPTIAGASLEDLNLGVALSQILRYSSRRRIQTPPVTALIGKAFANIEGSVRHLAPEIDMMEVFEAEFLDIMFDLASEAASEQQAGRLLIEALVASQTGPEQIRTISRDLANRELTVNVRQSMGRSTDANADRRVKSLQRTAIGMLLAALVAQRRRR